MVFMGSKCPRMSAHPPHCSDSNRVLPVTLLHTRSGNTAKKQRGRLELFVSIEVECLNLIEKHRNTTTLHIFSVDSTNRKHHESRRDCQSFCHALLQCVRHQCRPACWFVRKLHGATVISPFDDAALSFVECH